MHFMVPLGAAALAFSLASESRGAIVWDGPPVTFTKASFADWTLPENQDRITSNVWLTRSVAPNTTVVLEKPRLRMRGEGADELKPEANFQI